MKMKKRIMEIGLTVEEIERGALSNDSFHNL